jgi:hypothetical protein
VEEMRAQTAASLTTTGRNSNLNSSVQLAPDSVHFHFSDSFTPGRLHRRQDDGRRDEDDDFSFLRRSQRGGGGGGGGFDGLEDSKLGDSKYDDRISYRESGNTNESDFFTYFAGGDNKKQQDDR